MEVNYTFRFSDYDALTSACVPPRTRQIGIAAFWLGTLANFVFAVVIALDTDFASALPNFLIGLFLLLFWFFGFRFLRRRNMHKLNLEGQPIRVKLSEEGVLSSQSHFESNLQWSAFTRFSKFGQHAFLWINKLQALVIPFDAFKSDTDRDNFLDFIATRIKQQD